MERAVWKHLVMASLAAVCLLGTATAARADLPPANAWQQDLNKPDGFNPETGEQVVTRREFRNGRPTGRILKIVIKWGRDQRGNLVKLSQTTYFLDNQGVMVGGEHKTYHWEKDERGDYRLDPFGNPVRERRPTTAPLPAPDRDRNIRLPKDQLDRLNRGRAGRGDRRRGAPGRERMRDGVLRDLLDEDREAGRGRYGDREDYPSDGEYDDPEYDLEEPGSETREKRSERSRNRRHSEKCRQKSQR